MDFFPQRPPVSPKIYAYELIGVASHRGYIKVGYTERDVDIRIREQTHTVAVPYRVLETWPAMRSDGSCFTDTPRPTSSTPGSFTPRPVGSSGSIGAAKPSFGLNSQPAAQPKPPVKVDVSKIKVGTKVKHKAFGIGTVADIKPDMVTVRFGSVEKKFLLPAAIVQGYLMLI